MLVFIAGAISTGAVVARYSDERKSSAMPLANLPIDVGGRRRHQQQIDGRGERDVLDVGVGARLPLIGDHLAARDRLERERPDEAAGRARHDGDDVVALLLQAARDLDRLVGADAAASRRAR